MLVRAGIDPRARVQVGELGVGIDVGLRGAIAFGSKRHGIIAVVDMKTRPQLYGDGIELNSVWLANLLRSFAWMQPNIVVEGAHARGKQDKRAAWKAGHSAGAVYGVIDALGLSPYTKIIDPSVWKAKYGLLGLGKDASIVAAINKWDGIRPLLQRPNSLSDDRADACFLCDFALNGL